MTAAFSPRTDFAAPRPASVRRCGASRRTGAMIVAAAMAVLMTSATFSQTQTPPPRPPPPAPAPPKDVPMDATAQRATLEAIKAGAEVERQVLRSQKELYRQASTDRDTADARVRQLTEELDLLIDAEAPTSDLVVAKEREIADAETRRQSALTLCRELAMSIQEIQGRVGGLDAKIAALRGAAPRGREALTGSWRVTMLPGNSHGTFLLTLTGTIVQGQYALDGGWRGSLTGTFIDGKLLVQRIDSKLGRSAEFDGYLTSDGSAIQGSWRSYSLAEGASASGSWTASRIED